MKHYLKTHIKVFRLLKLRLLFISAALNCEQKFNMRTTLSLRVCMVYIDFVRCIKK